MVNPFECLDEKVVFKVIHFPYVQLIQSQNPPEGFGIQSGYGSTNRDTLPTRCIFTRYPFEKNFQFRDGQLLKGS
jgi:hypothetical protein